MQEPKQKKNPYSKFIGLGIVLLFTQPLLLIPIFFIGILYLSFKYGIRAISGGMPREPRQSGFDQRPKQASFDRQPRKLFCFHKDKGEHHVLRGRERDPWDRPDIDIRKYQRK